MTAGKPNLVDIGRRISRFLIFRLQLFKLPSVQLIIVIICSTLSTLLVRAFA
jgi:hypothetical protein